MIEEELPIGFSMELAKHLEILNKFSNLSDAEQKTIIENARQMKTKEYMQNYVESGFGSVVKK